MAVPPELPGFIALVTSPKGPAGDALNIAWQDPTALLNVDKAARADFVPFILLGDGGMIALWKDGEEQRVVFHDSEGQHAVLALSFAEFLVRLAKPSAALLEQVELEHALDTSKLVRYEKPKAIPAAVNRRLARWLEQHSLSAKPTTKSPATGKLRRALVAMAQRMLGDGLSKMNKPSDAFWQLDVRLVKSRNTWKASYLDYGKWQEVPARYGLLELLPELLPLMKSSKPSYELSIFKDGQVFADGGNQLTLEP